MIDATFTIRTTEILNAEAVSHKAHQSLLRVRHEILVPHNVKWSVCLLCAFHDSLAELGESPSKLSHIPVPPFGIITLVSVRGLDSVSSRVNQTGKRWEHIERVSHHNKSLVDFFRYLTILQNDWVMRLCDPAQVIVMTLSAETHDLKSCRGVNAHGRACSRSKDLLSKATEE